MAPTAMATIAPVDSSCEVESDSELPCDASGNASGGGGDGEGGDGEGGGGEGGDGEGGDGEGGSGGEGGADGSNLALLSDWGQREARWARRGDRGSI